jgi:hypothetical protein
MAKRPSTGKRLRFDVFKRDAFTCQYCGAQPPQVVLVVDHIHPVSAGGTSEIHNLISACETCNQGKTNRLLGDRAIRPDADLLFLETQQEIAELNRYRFALEERMAAIGEVTATLQELWCDLSGLDWHPASHIINQLLERYSPEIAEEAVKDVAVKMADGYIQKSKWSNYLFAVARNKAKAEGE